MRKTKVRLPDSHGAAHVQSDRQPDPAGGS